jgi:hypothetical protein
MVLGELYWILSAVWYWGNCIGYGLLYGTGGNCIGYGLLYGTGGVVLAMVCCRILEGLFWIWSAVWYWGNCIGYGLLYGTGGVVLDMVCCMILGELY